MSQAQHEQPLQRNKLRKKPQLHSNYNQQTQTIQVSNTVDIFTLTFFPLNLSANTRKTGTYPLNFPTQNTPFNTNSLKSTK